MDTELNEVLKKKQKDFVNPASQSAEQFAERQAKVGTAMDGNMKEMDKLVEDHIFSGKQEEEGQKKKGDYTHNYVLKDIKKSLEYADRSVYNNITRFGKAEPTEADKAKKTSIKGIMQNFKNVFIEKAQGKKGELQQTYLDACKEENDQADITTAVEIERLEKYTDNYRSRLGTANNDNPDFARLVRPRLAKVPEADKHKTKTKLFLEYAHQVLPFTKTYKKGWFGRYYTLDGNRIKINKGDLKPDAYNKSVIDGLMLQTEKENGISDKDLKANRKKKAVILERLTKEMIAYGEKFDPKKMTDLYITNHIVELQEYYTRLNAFKDLIVSNQWFFVGRKLRKGENPAECAVDTAFYSMIKSRILDMAAPVSNFLEEHLASHCIMSTAKFSQRENGFRKNANARPLVVVGDDNAEDMEDSKYLPGIQYELLDIQEAGERYEVSGYPFKVVNTREMSDEDKKVYLQRLQQVRGNVNTGNTGQILVNKMLVVKNNQLRPLSREINMLIKDDLNEYKTEAKKSVENYNKAVTKQADKIPEIPYLSANHMANENELGWMDLQGIKEKMHSDAGSAMYMFYGPELDHIYAKLYTVTRLQAELVARKHVIDKKMKFSDIRNKERDLKNPNVNANVKRSLQADIDKIKKDNLAMVKFSSKNPYAKFSEDYLAKKRLERAEQEYDDIEKQMAYTSAQIKVCRKVMNYFLTDPQTRGVEDKDYEVIRKFLQKEKLGYMFDVNKIDSFDKLLDEALDETEKDLQKEAGPNANKVDIKKRNRSAKVRAERIHRVRTRGRRYADTKETVKRMVEKEYTDTQLFVMLYQTKPEELSKYNIKMGLPMETKEQRNFAQETISLFTRVAHNSGPFSPVYYKNKVEMAKIYNSFKKNKLLRPGETFLSFMTGIRAKIELLSTFNNQVVDIINRQQKEDFAYFDEEALSGMSIHSLNLLVKNLKKKSEDLLAKANQAKVANVEEQFQPWVYKKRKEEYDNCKSLIGLVNHELLIAEHRNLNPITDLTKQAYDHKVNECRKDVEINIAIQEEFFCANETFLSLREISKDKEAKKKMDPGFLEVYKKKMEKDASCLDSEKKQEKAVFDLLVLAREIKVTPQMLEDFKKMMDSESYVDKDLLISLCRYSNTLTEIQETLMASEAWGAPKSAIKIRSFLDKKENKEFRNELEKIVKVYGPLSKMVNGYLGKNGILGVSQFTVNTLLKAEGASDEKIEENYEFIGKKEGDCKDNFKLLSDNIKNADELLAENHKTRIFKLMYDAGEKLELRKIDDWKKLVEKLAKDGFIKDKADKESIKWTKAAARVVLNQWPYSFEDFYAEHAKLDTGKALEKTFRRLAIKNGTAFVEDSAHSAEISAIISKNETMMYESITEDARKSLTEACKHAGYDPHVFMYLLKEVHVNGVGQVLSAEDQSERNANMSFVKVFVNRNMRKEGEVDTTDKNCENKRRWNESIAYRMRRAVEFKITSDMTKPDYIKKNFDYLYSHTKKFAALKMIYDQEKDILDNPEVIKRCEFTPADIAKIHNAFGPKTRSLYAMYFEMIEAYARAYFVDKEGHFDTGLTNEEMFGKKDDPQGTINSEENKKKITQVLEARKNRFWRLQNRVNTELDRDVLAEKVAKVNEINSTLKTINVDTQQNVFKMVQHQEFAGQINDVNIMMQNQQLADLIKRRSVYVKELYDFDREIERVDEQRKLAEASGDEKKAKKLTITIAAMQQTAAKTRIDLSLTESKIKLHQNENTMIYDRYNACHDDAGNLKLVENVNGVKVDFAGKYIEFQTAVYKDISKIYEDFKSKVTSNKKIKGKMFTSGNIVQKFKQNEMENYFRELKKLDLYLGMLEVDRKNFTDKGNKFDLMKRFSASIVELEKTLATNFANPQTKNAEKLKAQLENQIKEMKGAYEFLKKLIVDLDAKGESPAKLIHDYVQLIHLTLKSHGVGPDGKIVEEEIKDRVNGQLSEDEVKNIAYDEADKVGEAHVQLEQDINKRLGIPQQLLVKSNTIEEKPKKEKTQKKSSKK